MVQYFTKLTPSKPLYRNEKINKYIQYLFISQLKKNKKIQYFYGYIIKTQVKHKRIVFKREKLYKWMATKKIKFKDTMYKFL